MPYVGPSFGSVSHPRTQNEVPYTAYIPTSMLYNIYFLLLTSFKVIDDVVR